MFGQRLRPLYVRLPVWIVDTPANRAVAEELLKESPLPADPTEPGGVTLFTIDPGQSSDQWAAEIVPVIDLHHGAMSHFPPYTVLEFIGVSPTPLLRQALAAYDLMSISQSPDGFVARVPTRA
jgi:hypothetical protein